jgi:PAS domain-containing protein
MQNSNSQHGAGARSIMAAVLASFMAAKAHADGPETALALRAGTPGIGVDFDVGLGIVRCAHRFQRFLDQPHGHEFGCDLRRKTPTQHPERAYRLVRVQGRVPFDGWRRRQRDEGRHHRARPVRTASP